MQTRMDEESGPEQFQILNKYDLRGFWEKSRENMGFYAIS